MLQRLFLLVFTCLLMAPVLAQPPYPQGYFINPLRIPISLAGNFGECRPNHFHSGLDLKTEGKENYPVLAAAEGYVSRIKMDAGGFGHAIYITHPNGYTTLYAHLNKFFPALQNYVVQQQYLQKKWNVDVNISAEKFPVKQGQQIAWSGNTGSSSAPHLHFEIRNSSSEHPVNPQLFGFDIKDDIAPKPLQLFVYNGARSLYLQRPQSYPLQFRAGMFTTAVDTISTTNELVGLGVHLYDYMNGSTNTLAFYKMQWWANEQLQGSILMDDIGYEETRYLHAFADYGTSQRSGQWPILLFKQAGNRLGKLYHEINNFQGRIALNKEAVNIKIQVADVNGNTSEIRFVLKGNQEKEPATKCEDAVLTNAPFTLSYPAMQAVFPQETFYDTVCSTHSNSYKAGAYSATHQLLSTDIPAHYYFTLGIKANNAVAFNLRDKMVMRFSTGKKVTGSAATFNDGWYESKQRNFGSYWLELDTTAPSISPQFSANSSVKNNTTLRFNVTDNGSSVQRFHVSANGAWLAFEQRGTTWFYEVDSHMPKGLVTLLATSVDENGNERMRTIKINNP